MIILLLTSALFWDENHSDNRHFLDLMLIKYGDLQDLQNASVNGGTYVPNLLLLFIAHLRRRKLNYDVIN